MVEDYVLTSVPDLMRLINDQKADRPGGRGETYDGNEIVLAVKTIVPSWAERGGGAVVR